MYRGGFQFEDMLSGKVEDVRFVKTRLLLFILAMFPSVFADKENDCV